MMSLQNAQVQSSDKRTAAPYFPDDSHLFYFWKGRVALYAILKALDVGPGDEVILPGFTCVVVPNAILYLGARPVYADIDPETYTLSAATIEPLMTNRTKVILAQNTFGLSADLDPILALAQSRDIFVIEDCAHGLGGTYRGRRNGTVAHAAFFSTQWSKPISTGLGGIAYTRDEALAMKLKDVAERIPPPSLSQQVMLYAQLRVRPLVDYPQCYYPLVGIYRFLTRTLGLSVGSNSGTELSTPEMLAHYLQRMGPWQLRRWQLKLPLVDEKIKQHQQAAAVYDDFLTSTWLTPPYRPAYATHGMLRYTIRVPNRNQLLAEARKLHIPVGDWFGSPLYPVMGDLSRWGYQAGQCPVAEQACREVINLLTATPLSERQLVTLFSDYLEIHSLRCKQSY